MGVTLLVRWGKPQLVGEERTVFYVLGLILGATPLLPLCIAPTAPIGILAVKYEILEFSNTT